MELLPTKLDKVFSRFLRKISDYNFITLNMTNEEIEEELLGYLESATVKFHICEKNLDIATLEDGSKSFTEYLDGLEMEVLVSWMLVEYMKPQILATETLKQTLSDKDFKMYSQANQVRELRLLNEVIKAEAEKIMTDYSYRKMRVKK